MEHEDPAVRSCDVKTRRATRQFRHPFCGVQSLACDAVNDINCVASLVEQQCGWHTASDSQEQDDQHLQFGRMPHGTSVSSERSVNCQCRTSILLPLLRAQSRNHGPHTQRVMVMPLKWICIPSSTPMDFAKHLSISTPYSAYITASSLCPRSYVSFLSLLVL